MAILLLAEHDNTFLSPQTAKALAAALLLGDLVDILVAGNDCKAVAAEAAKLGSVRRVVFAEAPQLDHQLSEPVAALIVSIANDYQCFVAAATTSGKNVMPRLAALLDIPQISDVIEVMSADTFRRPIYAGNAIETVKVGGPGKVLTVRTTAFQSAPPGEAPAPIEPITVPALGSGSRFVQNSAPKADRPDLSSARVIVAGGRAFGSAEKFDGYLGPLADKLGAAIGASRAAVDAGYASNELQIGQTGKVVAPQLYIACGISGAIQHVAGMKDTKVIVAINSDADAPIFQIADYGLVGDLFEILPELTRALGD